MTDAGLVLHKLQRLKAQISLTRARRPAAADVLSHDLVLRDALALALHVRPVRGFVRSLDALIDEAPVNGRYREGD